MILLVKLILLTTIWVLGLTIITSRGMGLYALRLWAEEKIKAGERWVEPLFYCHWCAPSIHAIVGYGFAYGLGILRGYSHAYIILYPLVVAGSSLLCGLVWGVKELIENKSAYYINAEKVAYLNIRDRKRKYKESEGITVKKSIRRNG